MGTEHTSDQKIISTMKSVGVQRKIFEDCSFEKAMAGFPFGQHQGSVTALVYSRKCCGFLSVHRDDNRYILQNHKGEEVNFKGGELFEAYVFDAITQLHWQGNSDTANMQGRAVLLSEGDVQGDKLEFHKLPNQYVLWGKEVRSNTDSDWTALYDFQINELHAPTTTVNNDTVTLHTVEYFAADKEYGNLGLAAERLTGFTKPVQK